MFCFDFTLPVVDRCTSYFVPVWYCIQM